MLSIDRNPVLLLSTCQSDTLWVAVGGGVGGGGEMCRLCLNYREEEETDILPVRD